MPEKARSRNRGRWVLSPIESNHWGSLQATPGHFPNVFDYWSLPRTTTRLYRLSANCQPIAWEEPARALVAGPRA